MNPTDSFVSQDKAWFDWILPFDNMHVRTANGGKRDLDDRFTGTSFRNGPIIKTDTVRSIED